jgi:peptidoglycan/xylan/chitin deacetylase (PgdA/CDA1 family)
VGTTLAYEVLEMETKSEPAEIRAVSIMYHDVVEGGAFDASGFPGGDAAIYKVDRDQFKSHLGAIAKAVPSGPGSVLDLLSRQQEPSLLLTFDDGGASAYCYIADLLEQRGWHGHFFVTAGYIDRPSFLSREQIRELHRRGHIIGTHSFSHPERISHCSLDEMGQEWGKSVALLSDVIGERITAASVPGGFHSRDVARTAAEAGIQVLFTSQPTTRGHFVDGCLILGRYSIQRWMSAKVVAGLARGRALPHFRQLAMWNIKKVTKMVGGKSYVKLRKALLR